MGFQMTDRTVDTRLFSDTINNEKRYNSENEDKECKKEKAGYHPTTNGVEFEDLEHDQVALKNRFWC